MINYFQQGGQVADEKQQMQEMFMQYLAEKYQTEDINTLVQQLQSEPGETGETKLEDELIEFQQMLQQGGQAPVMAERGAKLDYIKSLKGFCPDGTQVEYYKNGKKICGKCIAKQENGAKMNQKKFFTPADVPSACKGGKAKKSCNGAKLTKKCKTGGTIEFFQKGGTPKLQTITVDGRQYGRYKAGQQWREVNNGKLGSAKYDIRNGKAQIQKTAAAKQREANESTVVKASGANAKNAKYGKTYRGGVYANAASQAEAEKRAINDKVQYYDYNGKVYKTKWNDTPTAQGVIDNRVEMAGLYGNDLGWRNSGRYNAKSRQHRNNERISANRMSDAQFNAQIDAERKQQFADQHNAELADRDLAKRAIASELMDASTANLARGFNPFGYVNDIVNGNYGSLAGRGLEAGLTLAGGATMPKIPGMHRLGRYSDVIRLGLNKGFDKVDNFLWNGVPQKIVSWGGRYMPNGTNNFVRTYFAEPSMRTGLGNANPVDLTVNIGGKMAKGAVEGAKNAGSKIGTSLSEFGQDVGAMGRQVGQGFSNAGAQVKNAWVNHPGEVMLGAGVAAPSATALGIAGYNYFNNK